MHTGLSIILGLMLAFLHQGNATTNTQALVQLDVTPTVDPSATPTETPTVTPTTTPEATPTDVPTATPTVTLTITPTVTPSVTPCAPEEENDKDDMVGLKANVHAFFGLVNAAFHHEKNEARFEAKHCEQVEVDKQGEGE